MLVSMMNSDQEVLIKLSDMGISLDILEMASLSMMLSGNTLKRQ
jgi:hypothetical protein